MYIYFDMDGTFVDLYGVDNWLNQLRAESPAPYEQARPLCNMSHFARTLNKAQKNGHKIGVQSETLSRHSVTYFNMDGDNSRMGDPISLLGFLKPYMKCRF